MACRRDLSEQAQPKSSQPPSKCLLARSCLRAPSFLRKQESLCSALDPCFRRDDKLSCFALGVAEDAGRSGIGEAARLREGSAGAAHGWAAIRFPWPRMVFGMRIALPSTGELPPTRRPGG